jgi:Uncharacterised nucleotidyltransferase
MHDYRPGSAPTTLGIVLALEQRSISSRRDRIHPFDDTSRLDVWLPLRRKGSSDEAGQGRQRTAVTADEQLWTPLERLLAQASIEGIRVHKLGALAARFRRRRGQPVPRLLSADGRAAAAAMVMSRAALERVRSSCEGPLVLIKGPEVARLYPGTARVFADLDLLVPDPAAVQRSLTSSGFVETGEFYEDAHHLRPLRWPGLGLTFEIHKRPSWPKRLEPPKLDEILEAATPSNCGVDGILTPDPLHHALILAAHGWKENPLGTFRDLVDVRAVSATLPPEDVARAARAWGLERIWTASVETTGAVLAQTGLRFPIRLWAGHLASVRERTILEGHLRGWLQGFSKLPPRLALLETRDAIRKELLPSRGEGWRDKLTRTADAVLHPRRPHSSHDDWPQRASR